MLILLFIFTFGICYAKVETHNENNTITDEIFFDIKIVGKANESWTGRFIVGVFGKAVPMTAHNFVALAKGFQHREVNDADDYSRSTISINYFAGKVAL